MTWSAFFAAMRRGVSERTAAATRRGGMQQQQRVAKNRPIKSQAKTKAPPKKVPPMEVWDFIMLDVSDIRKLPFSLVLVHH